VKLLEGYMENRTKEAALAAIMLALFFVTRNFKIQITPIIGFGLSAIWINTAASIFSWPYTVVFSLSTLYGGSSILALPSWFVGTQITFFLSKLVRRKWAKYTPVFGEIAGTLTYVLILGYLGTINPIVFLATIAVGQVVACSVAFAGSLVIWKTIRMLGIIE